MGAETVLTPLGLRPRHLVALTMLRDHADSTVVVHALADRPHQPRRTAQRARELGPDRAASLRRRPATPHVHLTQAGAERLAEAEFALAAVEDEILVSLDSPQRETLYQLLQIAGNGQRPECAGAVAEIDCR